MQPDGVGVSVHVSNSNVHGGARDVGGGGRRRACARGGGGVREVGGGGVCEERGRPTTSLQQYEDSVLF